MDILMWPYCYCYTIQLVLHYRANPPLTVVVFTVVSKSSFPYLHNVRHVLKIWKVAIKVLVHSLCWLVSVVFYRSVHSLKILRSFEKVLLISFYFERSCVVSEINNLNFVLYAYHWLKDLIFCTSLINLYK